MIVHFHLRWRLPIFNSGLFPIAGIASAAALVVIPVASAQQYPRSPQATSSAAIAAQEQPLASRASLPPTVIVVGFVGGFARNDDTRRPEVQIVQWLSEQDIYGLHAAAYENRRRTKARNEILHWLDVDGDGHLSPEEKQSARIILFGNSWGGSAAIKLARDLNRQGIPVMMTIEVDSINKLSGNDCLIPPNVAAAINFYQTRGLVHGCPSVRAANPERTSILGNYRFEYTSQPVGCRSYSWSSRHFFKTHEAMACDPRVWSQIEEQIAANVQSIVHVQPSQGEAELAAAHLSTNQAGRP